MLAWASEFAGRSAVVICESGRGESEGVAAWLRNAAPLRPGFAAALRRGCKRVSRSSPKASCRRAINKGERAGHASRPKLIASLVPGSFAALSILPLFSSLAVPAEALAVAERFTARRLTSRACSGVTAASDARSTNDRRTRVQTPPLEKLATIVRAADTDRLELAPEASGLLAAALGLSRMYSDDLKQLGAGMGLYDAFYRWARDASDETHDWPTNAPKKQAG